MKKVLSLFSGCGGMDLGFEGDFPVLSKSINKSINPDWKTKPLDKIWTQLDKTSFHTVFANDIRKDAKIAWANYFSKKNIDINAYNLESIVDLVKKEKNQRNSIFPTNIDVVTGGFPCQDFSVAGKRKGFESDKGHDGKKRKDLNTASTENRGQLYMWMKEVIEITMPKIFIAENVKGLVSLKDVKKIIENDFATINNDGYLVVEAQVLHSANYGVPQSRERVIFFGFKKSALKEKALEELSKKVISDEYTPHPPITHTFKTVQKSFFDDEKLLQPVFTKDAFVGLKEPEYTSDLSQQKFSKAKYMGKHCQGQTEVNLNNIAPTIRSEHHGNIEFRRLSIENGGKNTHEFENGMKERRLTLRECARIQTFPDDYDFIIERISKKESLSASSAYKLIGNAVPPLLAYHIAKRLEKNWSLYFK